ncbi:MAG: response regulator, partial [Bacteroidales bacterium]|nr:response regulator [Bacteroidales bacterium]
MKTALRILIVEDSEDDALLMLRQIKNGGYNIEYERVETEENLKIALNEKKWDIILADYKMPHLNGIEALTILNESCIDIPFIMVSGTIGEDVAVEAMKAGAHDYIMKNNLLRLLPAVERELHESEQRAEKRLLEQKQKLAENALLESEERYRIVADFTYDWEYWRSPDGSFLYISPSCERITGYSPAEFNVNPELLSNIIHPDDRQMMIDHLKIPMDSEKICEYEFRIISRNNQKYWIEHICQPVFGANGHFQGRRASNRDITDRKQAEDKIRLLNMELEKRVIMRTTQLEAANKELESFSYSVSHDLRAPLRGINGFSQMLLEDYQDKVDEQGKNYIQRVRTATQRMAQLIDDMLNLSHVSSGEMNIIRVNLSEIAREIADELRKTQPDRQFEFINQEGIKANGDSRLMRIVLENLIGNAWKFTSKHPTARIEFGELHENDQQVFFIRDDGAGFDMNYAQKLFGAFQRLHTEREFPGTGIGLATVQRVIRRHGGKVWAESEIEKGATFYFTLPG